MRFWYFLRNRQSLTTLRPIIQASQFRNAWALVPEEFRVGLLGGPNTKGSTRRFFRCSIAATRHQVEARWMGTPGL